MTSEQIDTLGSDLKTALKGILAPYINTDDEPTRTNAGTFIDAETEGLAEAFLAKIASGELKEKG